MTRTSIRFFKRKLNQVTYLKGNHLDQIQDQSLGIKDGFMDIIFLVTHLGITPLIAGQALGMEANNLIVPRDGISFANLNT